MTQEDATVTLDELRAPRTEAGRGLHATMHAGCAAADKPCELSDRLAAIEDAAVRDALSVEGREEQVAAIAAALRAVDQRIVAAYPETAVELLPGDEQGRHDYAAELYDAGLRFRPSETLA